MNPSLIPPVPALQGILLILLGMPVLYIFIYAVAGLFYRQPAYPEPSVIRRIAVLIPGYKEDNVIGEAVAEALRQDYPADRFDIIVIADSFLPETISRIKALNIKLIEVSFEKSTKAKALNRAMEVLDPAYDLAVVLDADNVMATDFLQKVNRAFENEIVAIQGHRTAKNQDTPLAVLDAASEEINNHIFRKGHRVLGLSSAIIGSGMAFRYGFFRDLMSDVRAIGGFDKEIELKMLKQGHTIEYLDDALVLDEKVQAAEVFTNQRRRWLAAQFHYFRTGIIPATGELFRRGNADYFDKAIQFIQPPRILLLGSVLVSGLVFLVLNWITGPAPVFMWLWSLLVASCLAAFLFSLPRNFYNRTTLRALAGIPTGFFLMFASLLHIRGANKTFLHTRHTSTGAAPFNTSEHGSSAT